MVFGENTLNFKLKSTCLLSGELRNLPQWSFVDLNDGATKQCRLATRRYRGLTLSFNPVSVCCVMWATSRYRGLSSSSVSVCCAMWALSSAQNVLYTCWCVNVVQTYNLLSEKWFTHASPTLFNSGTCRPQMSRYFVDSVAVDLKHVYYIHCILIVVGR